MGETHVYDYNFINLLVCPSTHATVRVPSYWDTKQLYVISSHELTMSIPSLIQTRLTVYRNEWDQTDTHSLTFIILVNITRSSTNICKLFLINYKILFKVRRRKEKTRPYLAIKAIVRI